MNETTHLLTNSKNGNHSSSTVDRHGPALEGVDKDEEHLQHSNDRKTFLNHYTSHHVVSDELCRTLRLAFPIIGTFLFEMLPGIVNIVLVGHVKSDLTQEYIDATALATMTLNLIGLCIGFGLSSALDTLCSQAFGANELHKMGIYLQSGIIVLSFTFIVVAIILRYTTEMLLALGQPVVVAQLAGQYMSYLIPGLFFCYLYDLLRKILQAQNDAVPMFVVSVVANIINIGVGYYLVYYTEWGWLGASVARTVCHVSLFLLLFAYIWVGGLVSTFWPGWKLSESLACCYEFLSLGVPGLLQLLFEWWAYEILALLCGVLPENPIVAIASNSILFNVCSFMYMIYYGICTAGSVRLGNALGSGSPDRAKLTAYVSIGIALCASLLSSSMLLHFRTILPTLFTHDDEIDHTTSQLLYIAAAFQAADGVNASIQGIFRGCGRQTLSALLNFMAYYVLGLPLGIVLAFKYHHGVFGLWIGNAIGLYFVAICGFIVVGRSDWRALAQDAKHRLDL